VRQAISCAINRELMIKSLMDGYARPALSMLPASHWAYAGDGPRFDYDPVRAERLLDDAGLRRGPNGIRFHLTMKTSTDEGTRLLAAAFSTARFSPKGANRSHYSNPMLDALLDDAAESPDQARRRADYVEAQKILAADLPAINLWYRDTVVVHNRRLTHIVPTPSGSYTFLETAEVAR
jgi:peptide/nickel transport system substrate-binding protein